MRTGTGSPAGSRLRRWMVVLSVPMGLLLLATSCSSSNTVSGGGGLPTQNVFVQKFRFHGLPTTLASGNLIINFSNRESLPITHEMVLIALPQGKTKQDVINDAKSGGAKSEDEWLHFGEIPEVDT